MAERDLERREEGTQRYFLKQYFPPRSKKAPEASCIFITRLVQEQRRTGRTSYLFTAGGFWPI